MKETADKSQCKDILQNTSALLLETAKVAKEPREVWETDTARRSLKR
jgi:hypothetical protein